jgi:hypothetical protein
MKKTFAVVAFFILLVFSLSNAQYADGGLGYMGQQGGMLMGGVGVTTIDDQAYFSINFRPELAFGKLGIGLNVNLLYDTETGHIRAKDWDSGYDYFRLLRYLRWGHKLDPVYMRIGTLDAARLGHGFIVNYYTNEASYDDRKIGMEFDLDFGQFGFETMTNNLGRAELMGGRAYYRPLHNLVTIPIIKNFAVGASYATDVDPDVSRNTSDGVSAYGFDAELPLIKTKVFNSMLYYDWAQISGYSSVEKESRSYGHGQAVGIQAGLGNMMGVLDIYAKVERRWLGKEFMPSFFDPFYEIQRFQVDGAVQLHKADQLALITKETMGVFGELYGNVMGNKVRLLGMFSRLDDAPKSGALHLAADAPDAIPTIAAHATYDKIEVERGKDLFTLDNKSIARVGLGYKIKPYLIFYMDYIWTFVETEPNSKTYKPQERVEPKLVFAYQF